LIQKINTSPKLRKVKYLIMNKIFSKALPIIFVISSLFLQAQQVSEDSYTRYELLDPTSQSFRILYDVSAANAGVQYYFNTLRKGSEHKVDAVVDLASGKKLEWTIVNGAEAKRDGLTEAEQDVDYLQVKLAHLVGEGAEYRLQIDKTYKDTKSYFAEKDKIVFDRSLGIKRNAVVLPLGYELIACNFPSQVIMEPDGRIKISFLNASPAEVPLHLEARKLNGTIKAPLLKTSETENNSRGEGRDKSKARVNFNIPERAGQTREIVYFLQQPETNSFRLYHDYTETKEGVDRYINVVRPGSKASNPSAKNLDTGKALKVETLRGSAITDRKLDIGEPVTAETEVVVIWYDQVKKGESVRLRIEETYTDPNRYILNDDELIFDRSFGRPFNVVILPEGWFLTASSMPATVALMIDGKVSLRFVNDRPDEVDVYIKARKRMP
jgi:hypothetical protein